MTEDRNITEPFRIAASKYLRISFRQRHGMAAGTAVAGIFVVAAIAASMTDIRWGIVALMVAMVVAPAIMGIYIMSEMMKPEVVNSSLQHTVEINDDGSVNIVYTEEEGCSYRLPSPEYIAAESLVQLNYCGEYAVITAMTNGRRRLIIFKKDELKLPECLTLRLSELK